MNAYETNTTQQSLNRRDFLKTTGAAVAGFTIVPNHVIAGRGHVTPSEKITVANIGCGTQGLRELPELLENPYVQVVSLCDPNKYAVGYRDWSRNGLIERTRLLLEDPEWGKQLKGIPGGRDLLQQIVNQYYAKESGVAKYDGPTTYADFRELLAQEKDLDAVKIMTPDHLHAPIALAALDKGLHTTTHKPIANRMLEAKAVIEKARVTGLHTHLLAWSDLVNFNEIKKWITDGVIGKLQSIHNWSGRPVWPQYLKRPTDTPPVPKGFDWDLWLGPVPDMPYHPDYTHMVFRGWYDFGGGSVADMGHYSLFPLFQAFGITTPPHRAAAHGSTYRELENGVSAGVDNDYAFPLSSTIRWQFPEQGELPAFDLYWYDGGIKPFAPEELQVDNRQIPREGLMFVGDKGKIMADFMGDSPRILPNSKFREYMTGKKYPKVPQDNKTKTWVDAIRSGKPSPGNFIEASCVTETINLGIVAIRAGKELTYDHKTTRITNNKTANQFFTREYRPGWEI